ncbi:helix-turn-helix transcriptional regulator [Xenorhabdus bovienii]|uniref:helix-turn-helix transcriptional regulator n=1 Tax=Xenorhabdus bovienii TaxID=40576 RepID=UPI003DA30DB6
MKLSVIKIHEVSRRTGLGKSTIYKYASEGMFPRPIKIGLRASAFIESEVDAWIHNRITESRN